MSDEHFDQLCKDQEIFDNVNHKEENPKMCDHCHTEEATFHFINTDINYCPDCYDQAVEHAS
jgi:hypothetical protein